MMKLAMVAIHRQLPAAWKDLKLPPPRMILQVHDELIFDVPATLEAVQTLKSLVRSCMVAHVSQQLQLNVPLDVKMCVGTTWGTMHHTE
mmetsp:Transcript_552/g.1771  ORF Transcript_552/g.1771 Transcript_552/m.1771 type:complete len:89 (+) Transcript_552:214-480(+)